MTMIDSKNRTCSTGSCRTANDNTTGSSDTDNMNFVERLFTHLLFNTLANDDNCNKLHIPSSTTKYRNKITYGCSTLLIDDVDQQQCDTDHHRQHRTKRKTVVSGVYSLLAEDYINETCRTVIEFWQLFMDNNNNNNNNNSNNNTFDDPIHSATVLLREIMVKGTRSRQDIIIRLTIQYLADSNDHNREISSLSLWDERQQLAFRQYMQDRYPDRQFCLCYNVMTQNTNIRPMKDTTSLYFIPLLSARNNSKHAHLQQPPIDETETIKYVMEMTPNQIEYQISPDTFSEVNHPVELLQWYQTKDYIDEFFVCRQSRHYNYPSPQTMKQPPAAQKPILIVSGRDISSFALGFGTLLIPSLPQQSLTGISTTPTLNNDNTETCVSDIGGTVVDMHNNNEPQQEYMFQHVIATQHCPLVHYDAIQNIQRYQQQLLDILDHMDNAIPKFSVHHCSKATMVHSFQNELLNYSTKIPVYGVMTGGRKGLDVSYVQFLNDYRSMEGIVYNSCATKSLLRDMTGFILRGGPYYLDKFRSYDFLPNTPYTASLTKLTRRPRTLIIVIGPAGVGKSTMVRNLIDQYSSNADGKSKRNNNIFWWERDRIFADLRNQGISLAKTKSLVHASLLKILRRQEVDDIDDDTAVIIIDSTNGNMEGRQLYVKEAKPDLVVYVNFQMDETDEEKVIDFLLECTKYRLNNNIDEHPSFPQTIEDQRIKHRNILRGMEYPTMGELEQIRLDNFPIAKRTVLLSCDPRNVQCRSQLAYRVFLEYTTSAEIRNALF